MQGFVPCIYQEVEFSMYLDLINAMRLLLHDSMSSHHNVLLPNQRLQYEMNLLEIHPHYRHKPFAS